MEIDKKFKTQYQSPSVAWDLMEEDQKAWFILKNGINTPEGVPFDKTISYADLPVAVQHKIMECMHKPQSFLFKEGGLVDKNNINGIVYYPFLRPEHYDEGDMVVVNFKEDAIPELTTVKTISKTTEYYIMTNGAEYHYSEIAPTAYGDNFNTDNIIDEIPSKLSKQVMKKEQKKVFSKQNFSRKWDIIQHIMPNAQLKFLDEIKYSEHTDQMLELAEIFEKMPALHSQRSRTKLKSLEVVYLHYFYGNTDLFILEKGTGDNKDIFYGYIILNGDYQNAEYGDISIPEIKKIAELDFYWDPIPLKVALKNVGHPNFLEEEIEITGDIISSIENDEISDTNTTTMQTAADFLNSLTLSAFPADMQTYIKETLMTDPDPASIPMDDPKISMIREFIEKKYPMALQPEQTEYSRQDLIDTIEGLRLLADEDEDAAATLFGLEMLLEDMPEDEKKNDEPTVYIEFLNKKKNSQQDKKSFTGPKAYKDAVKWAQKNVDKFDPDMIKYEYKGGGAIYDIKEGESFADYFHRKNPRFRKERHVKENTTPRAEMK